MPSSDEEILSVVLIEKAGSLHAGPRPAYQDDVIANFLDNLFLRNASFGVPDRFDYYRVEILIRELNVLVRTSRR
jgi:hypothetical protein